MLSYQRIAWPQWGQRERGEMIDSCAGSREMQTFRKLPNSSPIRNPPSSNHSDTRYGATSEVYGWRLRGQNLDPSPVSNRAKILKTLVGL